VLRRSAKRILNSRSGRGASATRVVELAGEWGPPAPTQEGGSVSDVWESINRQKKINQELIFRLQFDALDIGHVTNILLFGEGNLRTQRRGGFSRT